jgi:fructose-1,6-bisphosphatase II / sedoheptulose-1,7-bisphosphatase
MQGRLVFRNDDEKARAARWGITDLNRIYSLEELAAGNVIFAATGVTDGSMLRGVRRMKDRVLTETIVMRSKSGTVRYIRGNHRA